MKLLQKTILILYGILFFLVPLILWPYTSELFEFNKIVTVYLLTALISSAWIARMVYEKRFIFRRTILDVPLLFFLTSQIFSTLLSIDQQTSFLGYYSRFNGGLASTISYLILYWAFVSNINPDGAKKLIKINLASAIIVAIYGVLERLGIDKNIWQQDVQHRVFSTLGQPNWLAAWLVALIPITWTLSITQGYKRGKEFFPIAISILFFIVLLFTGSRSGLLGFAVIEILFWGIILIKYRFKNIREFLIINGLIALSAVIFGTQYTPSIFKLIQKTQIQKPAEITQPSSTVLEFGGTESGDIRKIVWSGAIAIWKHYPIFGTGVETFAYSYNLYRPAKHNITSEWDFIYNKAHNEYLNFLANTGTVGILAYLTMVGFAIYLIAQKSFKTIKETEKLLSLMPIAFLSGYVSILVTNFFGFSVVPVEILFFLYPAFTVILTGVQEEQNKNIKNNLTSDQKFILGIVGFMTTYLIIVICRYWYADYLYAMGVSYNRVNRQDLAQPYLAQAVKIEPTQSVYFSELSKSYTRLALAYNEARQATASSQLVNAAIETSTKSISLSPANVNLKRTQFGVFIMLTTLDPNYFLDAKTTLEESIKQAPTDAKLYYNLALIYSRIGQGDLAIKTLEKTIDLKPNYIDARLAYGVLQMNINNYDEAKKQFEYILEKIDPANSMAKEYLQKIP